MTLRMNEPHLTKVVPLKAVRNNIQYRVISGEFKTNQFGGPLPVIGMHTVSVPHGPDGSVLRWPFSCRSHTTSFHWTDGGRNGLGLFHHVTVLLSRPLDRHLRTEISATNFSFALSPNSPKSLSQIPCPRFPPRLLYCLCASRPSLHHSQTDRTQHRLPCSLKTALTPFTDRPSSTPASLQSQEFFYAVHGLFCRQCRFPCSLKSQECLSTSRSV